MKKFGEIRKSNLKLWKTRSKRVFKINDNYKQSIECKWQDRATAEGYDHINVFCSMAQFVSNITDLLRDYRYDKYTFNTSEDIDEIIFRYYVRLLIISSEILTDFQDLYILATERVTTRQYKGLDKQQLKTLQIKARFELSKNSDKITSLLDFINKVCKHKISNFHICNNHVWYLFEDFDRNIKSLENKIELGNIHKFISYDRTTFKKFNKAEYLVVPSLKYLIDIIINGYEIIDHLFNTDDAAFKFICKHFENK